MTPQWCSPLDSAMAGVKIYEDRMALAMPAAVARSVGRIRELNDLAGQEFILFPREGSPSHYDALVRILKAANIPAGRAAAADIPTIVGLVSAGLGCAIVPSSYKLHCPANIVIKEVRGLDLKFDLELVWRADMSDPLLSSFVRMFPLWRNCDVASDSIVRQSRQKAKHWAPCLPYPVTPP